LNYIGSKHRLRAFLKHEIKKVVGDDLSQKVFCDLFAGSGAVGKSFKNEVKQLISNDIEHYSYILNKNYIGNTKAIKNQTKLIEELNSLTLKDDGFIYRHYCKGSGSQRLYFSDYNGKKIDTIRTQLNLWRKTSFIDENTYYFLLASLIENADSVANTASIYSAFLKTLKKTAQKKLILTPAKFELSPNTHIVYNQNSDTLIKQIQGDILYLDPPYNQRQYGSNYHILNTISIYDEFIPYGITGVRPTYTRSLYAQKRHTNQAFNNLIKNANFNYIFLSYNNEGLMSKEFIKNTMQKYGDYHLVKKEYKKFHTTKSTNQNQKADRTYEYLHVLVKRYSYLNPTKQNTINSI